MFELKMRFLSIMFDENIEVLKFIFRQNSLHENCSALSLEDSETNLTLIGPLKREI